MSDDGFNPYDLNHVGRHLQFDRPTQRHVASVSEIDELRAENARLKAALAALKRRNAELEDRLRGYGFAVDSVRKKFRAWHPDILRFPGAMVIDWLHRRTDELEAENARLKAEIADAREALRLGNIGGIHDDFHSLADAIGQMTTYIMERERRCAQLEDDLTAIKAGTCAVCAYHNANGLCTVDGVRHTSRHFCGHYEARPSDSPMSEPVEGGSNADSPVCSFCHQRTPDVALRIDPFLAEIHDLEVWVYTCDDCYQKRQDDI